MGVVAITYDDQEASVTPPNGHLEPVPLTVGPDRQQNDVRVFFIAGAGASNAISSMVPMTPDPPTGYTSAYSLDPGHECWGAYYRRLVFGDGDTSILLPKPVGWQYFSSAIFTARGVHPTSTPTAGLLNLSYTVADTAAIVSSITVPSAGDMIFFIATSGDPGGGWPSSASSLGCPTGGNNIVATDKSGIKYYQYDTNPAVLVVGKRFTSAGSTGTVLVPCQQGSPAFVAMYMFLQPAADVPATLGAV